MEENTKRKEEMKAKFMKIHPDAPTTAATTAAN
jgi:hypothetical protein